MKMRFLVELLSLAKSSEELESEPFVKHLVELQEISLCQISTYHVSRISVR